ncbi:MAG: hypothetical protein D6712_20710 [Chloroflexi bacterium]|nr:MAG: hypothetical protein D6712_20710 [Chloroflexota bacterium]
MFYTLARLVGNTPVIECYQQALAHWREVLAELDPCDAEAIARAAFVHQGWFERHCGGRHMGQEVMVWAGIGQYFREEDGFGERLAQAQAMYHGLLESYCSLEVRAYAEDVAKLFPILTA